MSLTATNDIAHLNNIVQSHIVDIFTFVADNNKSSDEKTGYVNKIFDIIESDGSLCSHQYCVMIYNFRI